MAKSSRSLNSAITDFEVISPHTSSIESADGISPEAITSTSFVKGHRPATDAWRWGGDHWSEFDEALADALDAAVGNGEGRWHDLPLMPLLTELWTDVPKFIDLDEAMALGLPEMSAAFRHYRASEAEDEPVAESPFRRSGWNNAEWAQ